MSQRKLLTISLVFGLLTAFLVYTYVKAAVRSNASGPRESVQVVVAQQDIRPKTTITANMLAVRSVPQAQANPAALQTVEEALGRLAKDAMLAGEQVLESRLYAKDEKPGLTFIIPAGKRAVSVAVNEVIGVAGFVKPGDHVDVLGTFDEQVVGKTVTVTVLQDVEVLALSQRMEDKDPNAQVATTATLALTLDEAEKVTLAEERGKLRLALRPAGKEGKEYVTQASTRQMTSGKGKGLEQVVPGAKPPSRATSQAAQPTTAPTPAAPAPAVKPVVGPTNVTVAAGTKPTPAQPSWAVELFRGVNREVVQVDENPDNH